MISSLQEPVSMAGWLEKRTHGVWVRWTERFFLLRAGRLQWSRMEMGGDPSKVTTKVYTIDFSLTPCEVIDCVDSDEDIVIRPVYGHNWNCADQHRGAGTSRPLILDTAATCGRDWLKRLREHVRYGQGSVHARDGAGRSES